MSHDHGYKLLFSHPEMVRDLLTGFVHEDWVAQCDFDTLEKVGGSYVSDDLREREDDVVWRVRWGSDWLYVYLLLEFQSTVDHFMAVRLLGYLALLYQDLIRAGKLGKGDKLPPVLPLVLYNGLTRWRAPTDLDELIHPAPKGLERYRPQLHYLLLDEGCFDKAQLSELDNLVAALFQLEHSRNDADIREIVARLRTWLQAPEQTGLRRAFTVWIGRVLLPAKSPSQTTPEFNDLHEVQAMLAELVKQWVEEWKQEGIEQGVQQGIAQGIKIGETRTETQILLKLVKLKFGEVPEWAEEKIRAADKAQLDGWVERILTAESIEHLFAPLFPR